MTEMLIECSKCKAQFEPDDTHFRITAEYRDVQEPNDKTDYWFCADCWFELKDEFTPLDQSV